ncbi:Disease resistance protein [Camellia lanceoleosa]|uniref:Disease resistance protein n=1 Tax=Camellia lanceoleosa TaxID=1840588 RepID=A0ACC0H0E7_9ERIC|nr:Disease resistance protein [Camellia lanceoleosa]
MMRWSDRATSTDSDENWMKLLVQKANLQTIPIDFPEEYRFIGLRSLTITYCDLNFHPARVSGTKFYPLRTLEELTLRRLDLESISELVHYLHLRFSRLGIIEASECYYLKNLFSSSSIIPTLKNLEKVTISHCRKLVELFENASSSQSSEGLLEELVENAHSSQTLIPSCIVPNLRIMKLKELPKLETLGGHHQSWQHLEKLEVINCNQIKKLPFTTQNATAIKEIRGASQWWNDLEWDDEDTKSGLQ